MAGALQAAGSSVVLFLPKESPSWKDAASRGLPIIHLPAHRKYYDIPKAWKLAKILREEKVGILLFRDNFDMSLCASVKFILGKNISTIYFQGMQLGVPKKNIFHRLRYNFIDAWVSPLEWLKNQAIRMAAISPEKIWVVPLGTDISVIENRVQRATLRASIGIPENHLCAGIIGRLDRAKGQDIAIQAIAMLQGQGKNMHLIIQGEATRGEGDLFAEELHRLVRKNNLDKLVHFLPFNKDVSAFYNSIDIAVVASKNETFGMVTLEAMAWGKAIVGTNSAGTPELLEGGACGLLFEPANISQLSACLMTLSDEPELRESLAAAAKCRSGEFSIAQMTERLQALFRKLKDA
jgi:glycosyltransferase involved in cell wall biosynthesis